MTTAKPPAEAAQLSFVAALAVGDLARAFVPAELVAYKWPNDLLIVGAKAAGILIESGSFDPGGLWLAIGIGVNLANAPDVPDYSATSLEAHLASDRAAPTLEQALDILADAMAARVAAWEADGFTPVRAAWLAHAHGLGAPCTARVGESVTSGTAEGLDADGALLLRLADGQVRRITAGDVIFGGA